MVEDGESSLRKKMDTVIYFGDFPFPTYYNVFNIQSDK